MRSEYCPRLPAQKKMLMHHCMDIEMHYSEMLQQTIKLRSPAEPLRLAGWKQMSNRAALS